MTRFHAHIPQCEAYISFWNLEWGMVRQKLQLFKAALALTPYVDPEHER